MAENEEELKAVLHGNGEFTKHLYTCLAKNPGNIFFSPISIHTILSLASQGSAGQTQEALAKVLNIADLKIAAAGYKDVMKRLNSVEGVTLLMANKLFLKYDYKLHKAFKNVAEEQYFSEVQLLDFEQGAAAAKSINTWVEGKTNNKIKDLINPSSLDGMTCLLLVNAIYFKGKWAKPFKIKKTKTKKFYINDEETVPVQMMRTKRKFNYKIDENLDAKILELPYINEDVSMIIILPNERNGIAELEVKLAQTDLTTITENMSKLAVRVSLPKFKIEQTIDLKDSLTEIGLENIFNQDANFSGMIENTVPIYVSKFIQKAFIEVNEEGAEAAGAAVIQEVQCCAPPRPKEFTVDHPFVIILQARQANNTNVLFQGRIYIPEY